MATRKIQATKNYRLFSQSAENRPLDLRKHRKLEDSMREYGFLACFPIVCHRDGGKLIVKDGQHRLAIAESLGLAVHWIEEDVDFDVAKINCTAKGWALKDYAQKFAACGKKAYQDVIDFSETHNIPIGTTIALLAGTTSWSNVKEQYLGGDFRVKDRAWADSVAGIYRPLTMLSAAVNNARCLEACMAVCRVEGFDSKRMLQNSERCRHLLVSYSTRDAYLDMLEELYNFGRKQLVGLKVLATMAMRERNVVKNGKSKEPGPSKEAV